jgi:putative phosphonate metabolism protein
MAKSPRYAIYYAAEHGSPLDRFGSQLIGYDAYRGEDLAFPAEIVAALPDWRELTTEPRSYGFHATLKAPIHLASGENEAALLLACERFAAKPRAIPMIEPVVRAISGFTALVPAQPSAALAQLAADCVRDFDGFRAGLTDADRARRNPERLTPTQRDHLDRWGYPYVMDEFRFHMTLTGRLAAERAETVLAILRDRFAATGLKTLLIDRIALFRQENAGSRFRIIVSWQLHSAAAAEPGR